MAEHREPNYVIVLVWLAVLTVAEIVVVLMDPPALTKGILLVGMALSKVSLVALYFMHLKFERTSTLMFMMMPDLTTDAYVHKGRSSEIRSEMPHPSGH
jgi:heme/copper-type cytochrome/quinol oxidase subunit 4